MNSRVCVECGREFQPSSRHLRCPSCRSHNLCACGARKQYQAATCSACHTESGASNNNWRGERASPQRRQRRQPPREPGALDGTAANRHPCCRRHRLGTRDTGSIRGRVRCPRDLTTMRWQTVRITQNAPTAWPSARSPTGVPTPLSNVGN